MATAIRPIGHEDRLSLVDHLEELRTRLIVSALAFVVAFGLCFWQNHALLRIINDPYEHQTQSRVLRGEGQSGQLWKTQQQVRKVAGITATVLGELAQPGSGLSAQTRAQLKPYEQRLKAAEAQIPRSPTPEKLTTLGLAEPFTTTLTVSMLFAAVLSLPVILYELYGFVLPAFSPRERRVANSLVGSIPLLFVVGVLFGYFVVLPAAVHFFQNFNSNEFNTLVQASQYYRFAATIMLAMGLIFQVPVAILAATRLGIVTPAQLRKHRRYAIIACAAIAAFLPGDVVTLILETVPLYLLYELSIIVASIAQRREARREAAAAEGPPPPPPSPGAGPPGDGPGGGSGPPGGEPAGPGPEEQPVDPEVREVIDHFDRSLFP
jgi:sec-independent protein translocase protein TatC